MRNYITRSSAILLAVTLLFGIILSSPKSHADTNAAVNISVEVPSVCSLSMDDDSHSITMQAGTYRTIGTSIIKAVCNDPDGLAVYAVGYGNETYGENRLIGSFSGNPQYIPSNASSGTPSASEWNMTLTAITGTYAPTITTGYTTAHAIPTTYTKVAYRNSATDVDATGYTATGANFSAKFDIYAAPNQLPSTYSGKVKFLLVHPNILAYDEQTGQPETMTPNTIVSPYYMQDVAIWGGTVEQGQTVSAIDRRDNSPYTVARLADGELWMTKNLRLDFSTFSSATAEQIATIESQTNNPAPDFFTSAKSISSSNTWCSDATPACVNQILYDISNLGGENCSSGSCDDYGVYYNWYVATAGRGIYDLNQVNYSVLGDICPSGWRLPIGGTKTNKNNSDWWKLSVATVGAEPATGSLPIYYNTPSGEGTIASTAMRSSTGPNLLYSGYHLDASIYSRHTGSRYWSSTVSDSSHAFHLYMESNLVYPGVSSGFRYNGFAIRCIAK